MSIVTWNIQGIASRRSLLSLKNPCSRCNPTILVLVETKLSGSKAGSTLAILGFDHWIQVKAFGMSRGIWLFWKSPFEVYVIRMHSQYIHFMVKDGMKLSWFFVAICGSPREHLSHRMFSSILDLAMNSSAPWLLVSDFNNFLDTSETTSLDPHINPNVTLLKSLNHMQSKFMSWKDDVFGSLFKRKRWILARILGVQGKLSHNPHNGLIQLETKLRRELETILDQEQLLWFQKSRERWILEADRNTTFYHTSVVIKGNKRKILSLKNDSGVWCSDHLELEALAFSFYKDLYSDDNVSHSVALPGSSYPCLSNEVLSSFHRPFTKE
ncbi:hypothetical protein P3X46_012362 [Hevea brasiliensis]|uniref:Endonuclease/exonuclease/phosphatase domain-containing protein n=1 Tax=Hevea brasiliensis TaxID=3981 RepID=A0ABQ9MDL8_HEVBR|nr:hypothetical protein P3X46_012362 [Hevea brasiliensis]